LSPLRGGGAEFASVLRLELALRAGRIGYQRWLVHCTPHFLFFFQKKKRKRAVHGPKEKKK